MIPMSKRPPGYLLSVKDLTEAVYWARSLSGVHQKAQVPFKTLIQFELAAWENEIFTLTPAFDEWMKEFDAMHNIDMQAGVVWLQWFGD